MKQFIAPSVLAADFANLQRDVEMINKSEADWFHIDVMDGVFVPNISFGMPVMKAIKKHAKKPMDVHLMIVDPDRFITDFKDAGADILTVHYEACTHLHRTLQAIKIAGMQAGVALNPHTPIAVLEDVIRDIDLVCIMSVNPGFGGQSFIENTYKKIIQLKDLIEKSGATTKIEIDGGVNDKNAGKLLGAGADVLVAGSFVFKSENPTETIAILKKASVKYILKTIFLVIIVISSCSTDDSLTGESNKCRLTKYGLVITPLPSGNDTIYRNEVDYINSKIVVRSNFGPDPIINYWRLLSKDSAIYNQQDRIAKIYHINTRYSSEPKIERYSEFIYDSFNNRPSKIKETRYQLSDNFSYIISEDIIYNEHNQIAQTFSINSTYRINTLTNYSYGDNRNLSKIVQINERFYNQEVRVDSIVATFKNYDDKINPFQSFPFLNLKGFSDSPNNFTISEELRYEDGEVRNATRSGYIFEYNDMDYPLIGEYNCQ